MTDNQFTLSKRICMASDGYLPDIPAGTTFPRLGEGGEKMKPRI